jgi:hypothetical protein
VSTERLCHSSEKPRKKKHASSPQEIRLRASELFTTPLNETEREQLKNLAQLPDSNVDLNDAPEIALPSKVEVGRFYIQSAII